MTHGSSPAKSARPPRRQSNEMADPRYVATTGFVALLQERALRHRRGQAARVEARGHVERHQLRRSRRPPPGLEAAKKASGTITSSVRCCRLRIQRKMQERELETIDCADGTSPLGLLFEPHPITGTSVTPKARADRAVSSRPPQARISARCACATTTSSQGSSSTHRARPRRRPGGARRDRRRGQAQRVSVT